MTSHRCLLSVMSAPRGALVSESAAGEVGDQLRRRRVEADDVEHARVGRVGDREAVRDHADHDQPRVDAGRLRGSRGAPGPGGCRPPRSPSRCRSRTCRSPARAPARTASAARSRCRRTAGPTPSCTTSSSRCRGLIASGVRPCSPQPHRPVVRDFQPRLPAKKPTDLVPRLGRRRDQRQRRRRVARRQARHAGDRAAGHRAGHVERQQQPLARRLDVAERRVERGVERVDDLAHRAPLARGRVRRDRPRRSAAPPAARSGGPAPGGCARASPSCATTCAVPSDPGASRPTRVIVARLRIIAVIGMSSSSASQTAASVRCSVGTASRGRPYSRTSAAVSRRRRRRLRADEALDQARQPVGLAAADDPLEQASVLGRDARASGCPRSRCAAGWASRSTSRCVTPSRWRYLTAW